MKNIYSVLAAVLFLLMLLIPLSAKETGEAALPPEQNEIKEDVFLIKIGDEIKELPAREYIIGVVAAEMPALYPEEALKAQAVAAYTYAARKRNLSDGEYHLTSEGATDQSYITESERLEKWGENTETYETKIAAAVDAVCGQALYYEEEPIFAAYHAISCGKTETGENVWGGDYPYLQSVDSVCDMLAEQYQSEVRLPLDEAKALLSAEEFIIGECRYNPSGTVSEIVINNATYKGTEIRKTFSLRSAAFTVTADETEVVFAVRGYGHGVGMSQHGAKYMAEQGADYKEILRRYYIGCEIK